MFKLEFETGIDEFQDGIFGLDANALEDAIVEVAGQVRDGAHHGPVHAPSGLVVGEWALTE